MSCRMQHVGILESNYFLQQSGAHSRWGTLSREGVLCVALRGAASALYLGRLS